MPIAAEDIVTSGKLGEDYNEKLATVEVGRSQSPSSHMDQCRSVMMWTISRSTH